MAPVISAQNLGKKYILNHQSQERYTALRDVLTNSAKHCARKLRHPFAPSESDPSHEVFWALKELSFDIQQGDRVGIIGRNGAGKSTLLKILSRITEPTTGKVRIQGRVASLLEVGTGFHPELTGRENIFLNGAVLGMSKIEIKKKFDDIVAFAEIEKFLDTPVKRYSSGMYVRLAFAVAAQLESEILIVDEVLAVGDAQFQKKCLGKMEQVGQDGRTVIFVSHNMAAISNLCQKGIALQAGSLLFQGSASEAILKYYQSTGDADDSTNNHSGKNESDTAKLLSTEIVGVRSALEINIHNDFIIRMKYEIKRLVEGRCVPNFHFFAPDGSYAFATNAEGVSTMPPGIYFAECKIPGDMLNEGTYFIGVALTNYHDNHFTVEFFDRNALTLNVIDPMDEHSNRYGYAGPMPGVLRPKFSWNIGRAK